MTEKRRNFFCHVCKQFAEWVLIQFENDVHPKWKCCCCNPLLLESLINEYYPLVEIRNE